MRVDEFDFELPEQLIALRPAVPRDSARLLVVRQDGTREHRIVSELPQLLRPGDVLVTNDTKVGPARLKGVRHRAGQESGGARIELLLHRRLGPNVFRALIRPAKRIHPGDRVVFGALTGVVLKRDEGEAEIAFNREGRALDAAIGEQGEVPLPPYIASRRAADARDASDYQTVYARESGSVAAPTAGLHFTPELLQAMAAKGIEIAAVTLHVGLGTFLPVTVADSADHAMHAERAEITASVAAKLNRAKAAGGRIVAVGSTALRTLETACGETGVFHPFGGETDLFITPGYRFKAVDILLTNFHLPRSTLFMLVSAFSGTAVMKSAYTEAMGAGYRFYSYGDACLLFRAPA